MANTNYSVGRRVDLKWESTWIPAVIVEAGREWLVLESLYHSVVNVHRNCARRVLRVSDYKHYRASA